MKKLLLMFVLIGFTCLSANAGELLYTLGVPMRYSSGNGTSRSIYRYGRNASFTPANQARAAARQRAIRRYEAITKSLENDVRNQCGSGGSYPRNYSNQRAVALQQPISRFDRNYTVSRSQKAYTRGGVTYYN